MLLDTLKDIGLNDKEARIYLATLELGSSGASDIAKRAKLNRVTTYDILDKLIKKGFINFITKDGQKHFDATEPDLLFEDRKRRINAFEDVLPELRRLHGATPHPRVQYFEGIAGIKAIYEDTLSSKTEILNYANSSEIREYWPEYDDEYVKERALKGIFLRGIAPTDPIGKKVVKENKKYFRDIRLIDPQKYNFTNEINIYDDKISIISFSDGLIGMIIESKEMADTQRALFSMIWDFSEEHHTTKAARKSGQLLILNPH